MATGTDGTRVIAQSYGPHAEQVADLYLPSGQAPGGGWPCVTLVHGGFWRQRYGRDLMVPLADDLVGRGRAVWNVEYRRVGGAGGWPTTLTDVAAALDHLVELAESFPVDLGRVAVVGHSAGGQLALWAAGRCRLSEGAPGSSPSLVPTIVIGQAPVADLVAGQGLGDGAVLDLLGGGPDEVPDRYHVADPVRLVGHGVPIVLVHGESDDVVPPEQSHAYARAAEAAGDDVTVVARPGDHLDVIDPAHTSWHAVVGLLDGDTSRGTGQG